MKKFKQYLNELEDYVGYHSAPDAESGSPLHDLTDTYPDDIYGINGVRYYGDRTPFDYKAVSIMSACRNKPNKTLMVYRSVPHEKSRDELIQQYENEKRYILKHGKIPNTANTDITNKSDYYDYIYYEIERLEKTENINDEKQINIGDWVTTVRAYAVIHGKRHLDNYKILSKQVRAKDVFSGGESILEYGYDPQ